MPNTPYIRRLTSTDLAAVARLWHDAWHDGHGACLLASSVAERTPSTFAERIGPVGEGGLGDAVIQCLDGNHRAHRFCGRNGWTDTGRRDLFLRAPDGRRKTHPTHVLTKHLSSLD